MIQIFRKIRQRLLTEIKFSKYLFYALGEIFLVVIGILIALQINNWNEDLKSEKDEKYVLTEILKNLEEDAALVDKIISQRQKAQAAVLGLEKIVTSENRDTDSLQTYLTDLLTFERYFPINNAYEILKFKGLQLSDNELTTIISRYYDYEQPKMGNSILDIEIMILRVFNNREGLVRFLSQLEKDRRMVVKNPNDPSFIDELSFFLPAFRANNSGTLQKLLVFRDINSDLQLQLTKGLDKLN